MARASAKKATKKKAKKKPVAKKAAKKPAAKKAKKKVVKKAVKAKAKPAKAKAKAKPATAKRANATVKAQTKVKTGKDPQLSQLVSISQQTLMAINNLAQAISTAFSGAADNINKLNLGAPNVVQNTNANGGAASVDDFLNPTPERTVAASPAIGDDFLNPGPSATAAPKETKAPKLTKDHAIEALQKVSQTGGLDKMKEVLGEFKVARISEIKPEDYAAFIASCKKAATVNTGAASTNFL